MQALTFIAFVLAADGWVDRGVTKDGITIETKKMPGSAYETVRVSSKTPVPPDLQADVIWGPAGIEGVANKKNVRTHEVLREEPTYREFYEVISAPLISDRDFVMKSERRKDGVVHEIRFTTIDDPKKPPVPGMIRMQCQGYAVIEPGDGGGSIVTYEVFTDLGGALPAWIARGPQRDTTVEWIRVMTERGLKAATQQKK